MEPGPPPCQECDSAHLEVIETLTFPGLLLARLLSTLSKVTCEWGIYSLNTQKEN